MGGEGASLVGLAVVWSELQMLVFSWVFGLASYL